MPTPRSGSLAVSVVSGPAHGSLTLNADGTFSYTHDGSETTTDSFTYKLNDGSADSNTATVSITVTPVNDAPFADPVLTDSGSNSHDLARHLRQHRLLQSTDVGGGLDGTAMETPEALGGADDPTPESGLVFTLTSIPTYGFIYIDKGNNDPTGADWIKVTSTSDVASQTFTTADKLYWIATSDDPLPTSGASHVVGMTDSISNSASAWTGVTLSAVNLSGSAGTITFNSEGTGVVGHGSSTGPTNQITYDPTTKTSEQFIVDFNHTVSNAEVTVNRLIPFEGGGEIGVVSAYKDGKLVGAWSFGHDSTPSSGADIKFTQTNSGLGTFTIPTVADGFDRLIFTATEYVNPITGSTDSSDYYVQNIAYTDQGSAPTVSFDYKVTDAGNLSSAPVSVVINPIADNLTPPALATILDGSLTTNTNSNPQKVVMTFVDLLDPMNAYAKAFSLNGQGQTSDLTQETGFAIQANKQYAVSLEQNESNIHKVNVTASDKLAFSLEGVTIITGGNDAVTLAPHGQNDGSGTGTGNPFAVTAIITPQSTLDQSTVVSTDGTGAGTTLSDPSASQLNYLFGAGGNDTLNGGTGSDIMNGGLGSDSLNGGAGNDILVYDTLDTNLDGGAGFDVLRLDASTNLIGKTTVHNIEALLITDDAVSSPTAGSTVSLHASDVLNFTDNDNTLFVRGNTGDTLNIGTGWVVGNSTHSDFTLYTHQPSVGNLVQLYVEDHVTVTSS